jgi:Flp pilus assembly protein TadD
MMFHPALFKLVMALVLLVGGSGYCVVDSWGDGGPDKTVAADANGPKQGGNGFLRALKAPFKAIGRLFGGGKDDNKPRRLTEKDIKKFESAKLSRVKDARSPAPPQINNADSPAELNSEARSMISAGNLNEAIGLLTRTVSIDQRNGEAFHLLGIAYSRKGLPEMARSSFERAVKLSPGDAQTLNDYGFALYLQGEYEAAAKRLKSAAKLAPNNQRIWNNLALAQYRMEKYDDALKSFVKAEGDYQGRLNLAAAFARSGRVEEATKNYEAAIQVRPGSTEVLAKLVGLYKLMGRTEEAEAARQSLIANGATAAAGGH